MDIPDLVRAELDGEEIRTTVSLGDEDALCLTPTRAIHYTAEGLLSDESVSVYPLDVERLRVSEGRRKTKFELLYVEGPRSFAVPAARGEDVLEYLLEGILRVDGVSEADESVAGVYRFSELTLIVTDGRLVKHVGANTWDEDFEEYPFADVTGLDFEEGSVATQIVIAVDGRPERIKAPNDQAPLVRRTLENALFEFHGVGSLPELNDALGGDEPEAEAPDADEFALDDDIDPLVGGEPEDALADEEAAFTGGTDAGGGSSEDDGGRRPQSLDVDPTGSADDASADEGLAATGSEDAGSDDGGLDPDPAAAWPGEEEDEDGHASGGVDDDWGAPGGGTAGDADATEADASGPSVEEIVESIDPATGDDLETLEAEVAELRDAVAKQNELLRKQHRALRKVLSAMDRD